MKEQINKNIDKSLVSINIVLTLFIFTIFFFKESLSALIYPINVAFFMFITFISIIFLGFKKNKRNRDKDRISNIYVFATMIYLTIIFLAGNATGYLKQSLSIMNIIYMLIITVLSEIIRYLILNKCSKRSNQVLIITFLYILYDILVLSSFSIKSMPRISDIFTITLIAVIKNTLLSFTSYKFGYYPCILYSFIIIGMPLVFPIYPALGNYLSLVFIIIYSSLIYYFISKPIYRFEEEKENKFNKNLLFYSERVIFVFLIIIIFLVSGNFKYSLSAIASDSMYPELKKGDGIILEKISDKNENELKEGTIIAFSENDSIITHRIISIEIEDGKELYITKGDNNATKDVTKKTKDDIIGIVKFRIPLIGYPSVEISEIRNK